ncbi:FCD domain-containing protein [Nisaea sp.]|uniref:GntR family transcriptional regulator n=1 Tax=Nisaea sp. TaxID=2024842 RepID=UPI0032ED01B8
MDAVDTNVLNTSALAEPGRGPESRTTQACAALRQDILSGALGAGVKLKIDQLRERYDLGASPIREALSLLTSDGLVERLDQRGFRVAPVSGLEFRDILKTRCWMEERALRDSIAAGDSAWQDRVVLAYYRLSRTPRGGPEAGDLSGSSEWEALHKAFHMALIGGCGSDILIRFCDQLYDRNIRYRQLSRPAALPKRDIEAEHKAIMEAAIDGDADAAVAALIAHYTRTGGYLEGSMLDTAGT